MGGQPARNAPAPKPLTVRCPFCKATIEVRAAPLITVPCGACGKLIKITQGVSS